MKYKKLFIFVMALMTYFAFCIMILGAKGEVTFKGYMMALFGTSVYALFMYFAIVKCDGGQQVK